MRKDAEIWKRCSQVADHHIYCSNPAVDPSVLGYLHTRVNYDILSYLPENIETMKGQDILVDEFGTGAFSTFVVDGMSNKEIKCLKEKSKMWIMSRQCSGMTA